MNLSRSYNENKKWINKKNKNTDVTTIEAEEEILTMTSLGKLIFADINSRHTSRSSSDDCDSSLSTNYSDDRSISLAFENLFFMPYDIIEKYDLLISTLDISHNKFSR